jgi:hypothetical protein
MCGNRWGNQRRNFDAPFPPGRLTANPSPQVLPPRAPKSIVHAAKERIAASRASAASRSDSSRASSSGSRTPPRSPGRSGTPKTRQQQGQQLLQRDLESLHLLQQQRQRASHVPRNQTTAAAEVADERSSIEGSESEDELPQAMPVGGSQDLDGPFSLGLSDAAALRGYQKEQQGQSSSATNVPLSRAKLHTQMVTQGTGFSADFENHNTVTPPPRPPVVNVSPSIAKDRAVGFTETPSDDEDFDREGMIHECIDHGTCSEDETNVHGDKSPLVPKNDGAFHRKEPCPCVDDTDTLCALTTGRTNLNLTTMVGCSNVSNTISLGGLTLPRTPRRTSRAGNLQRPGEDRYDGQFDQAAGVCYARYRLNHMLIYLPSHLHSYMHVHIIAKSEQTSVRKVTNLIAWRLTDVTGW